MPHSVLQNSKSESHVINVDKGVQSSNKPKISRTSYAHSLCRDVALAVDEAHAYLANGGAAEGTEGPRYINVQGL